MKKKIIMTLLASTLIVGSMTGCGSTKLTKSSITIELGNEDAIKISDFMDLFNLDYFSPSVLTTITRITLLLIRDKRWNSKTPALFAVTLITT